MHIGTFSANLIGNFLPTNAEENNTLIACDVAASIATTDDCPDPLAGNNGKSQHYFARHTGRSQR